MYEHNVYDSPSRRAKKKFGIGANQEVYVTDTTYEGKQMWVEIRIPNFDSGWVRNNKVIPYASTETICVKHTTVEVMEAAGQPISTKIAEFYEWTHSLWDSTEYLHWINVVIILIVWLVAFAHYNMKTVGHWWEYVLMFIAGATAIMMWLTSDLFNDSCNFGIWWLDLIFGLLAITLPIAYWLSSVNLLNVTVERVFDEPWEWTQRHIAGSFALLVPLAVCYWWFKSVLDIAIICYLSYQGICFLILLIKTLLRKQIAPFFRYTICFIMLVFPMIIMSIISLAMIATLVMMVIMFIAPLMQRKSGREVVGYEVKDQYGNTIDKTDAYGHSSQTGRDYRV